MDHKTEIELLSLIWALGYRWSVLSLENSRTASVPKPKASPAVPEGVSPYLQLLWEAALCLPAASTGQLTWMAVSIKNGLYVGNWVKFYQLAEVCQNMYSKFSRNGSWGFWSFFPWFNYILNYKLYKLNNLGLYWRIKEHIKVFDPVSSSLCPQSCLEEGGGRLGICDAVFRAVKHVQTLCVIKISRSLFLTLKFWKYYFFYFREWSA